MVRLLSSDYTVLADWENVENDSSAAGNQSSTRSFYNTNMMQK